jgi:hypothetical protein
MGMTDQKALLKQLVDAPFGQAQKILDKEVKRMEQEAEPISIIAAVCESVNGNGFCFTPRIEHESGQKLDGFDKQESDFPGVKFEFVKQRGPGIAGDDYTGTLAVPIGNGYYFVVDYST